MALCFVFKSISLCAVSCDALKKRHWSLFSASWDAQAFSTVWLSPLQGHFPSITAVSDWCREVLQYVATLIFLTQPCDCYFPDDPVQALPPVDLLLDMMKPAFRVQLFQRLNVTNSTSGRNKDNRCFIFSFQMDWITPEMWSVLCEPRCFSHLTGGGERCCTPLPWQQKFFLFLGSWWAPLFVTL